MITVDLRSDTLTRPTAAMREAMMQANVGDDVFNEDPTLNRLQDFIVKETGMEAALFVTSGTQGNQICLKSHTNPGQEVLLDYNSHIMNYESGAPAMLAGVQLHPMNGTQGVLTVEQLKLGIRPADDHYPQTGLICLENTHNRAGGTIYPIREIERISQFAKEKELPLHLDGARLWNACDASGILLKDYCRRFDSVSLCFSKGLGAPVGSIVAGKADFIKKAHFYRKAYGGGIRQGGILAAAALHALEHHRTLLNEDHRRARWIAEEIDKIDGLSVELSTVQTHIVIFEVDTKRFSADYVVKQLAEMGIHMFVFGPTRIRIVTHLDISDDDIAYAADQFRKLKPMN